MTTQYIVEEILRRDIVDLEKELQRQKERAEKAEMELKAAREQKPALVMCGGYEWSTVADAEHFCRVNHASHTIRVFYAHPIPAPAVPDDVLLCDTCGADCENNPWHYSKGDIRHLHACDKCYAVIRDAADKPAVPYGIDEEAANRISLAVYDWKNGINPEPLLYTINRILATETHPLSEEGQRALLQSAGGGK